MSMQIKPESVLPRPILPVVTRGVMKMMKIWISSPINRKTSTQVPGKQVVCSRLPADLCFPTRHAFSEFMSYDTVPDIGAGNVIA
jgi:hypothetical protein